MTAPKRPGYPCHIDEDLAHVAGGALQQPKPCSRRHKPVPVGAKPGTTLAPRTRVRLLPDPPKSKAAPAGPAQPAHATPKRATRKAPAKRPAKPKRGTAYDETTRLEALDAMAPPPDGYGESLADVHRRTGIPKTTLSRWARQAGVDLGEQARAKASTARTALEAKVTAAKVTTVTRLERILELELETHEARAMLERAAMLETLRALNADGTEEERLDAERLVRIDRTDDAVRIMLKAPDSVLGQLLGALGLLGEAMPKRDTVGAWTRANHDLALIKGEATERGDVIVRFGIPRPDPRASDAAAIDEKDLNQ